MIHAKLYGGPYDGQEVGFLETHEAGVECSCPDQIQADFLDLPARACEPCTSPARYNFRRKRPGTDIVEYEYERTE